MPELTNVFDFIAQQPGGGAFELAMCAALGHLNHPAVQEFEAKLRAAIRQRSCGRREPAPRTDPRLDDLHAESERVRAEQHRAKIAQAEHHARRLAPPAVEAMASREDEWLSAYTAYRDAGKTHRDALREVAGYDPKTPRRLQESLPVDVVAQGVVRAQGRAKREARAQRTAAILRLGREGLSRWEIAEQLEVSYSTVHAILKQAGVHARDRRRKAV